MEVVCLRGNLGGSGVVSSLFSKWLGLGVKGMGVLGGVFLGGARISPIFSGCGVSMVELACLSLYLSPLHSPFSEPRL
jgi:hypothetical protein